MWMCSRLLCWVLMPDHWHGLLQLRAGAELGAEIRRFKSVSARVLNLQLGRAGPLWAAGFHDHALRGEVDMLSAARYLVGNPLRASLVDRVGDYPFWNAVWLSDRTPV